MTPLLKSHMGAPRARLARPKGLGGWGMGPQGPMSPLVRQWPLASTTLGGVREGQAARRTEARAARLIYSKDTLEPTGVWS